MVPVLLLAIAPAIRFEAAAGPGFVLRNHPTPEKQMIETMAGGLAAFDYDGDGRLDLFFTNGAAIPSMKKESEADHNRLYRNEGGLRFRDVTGETGLAGVGYSMGAAAADFDNDGDADLFVAGVYRNNLYRNDGGRFVDITGESGIGSSRWSVTAGWFDYDNDGLLDLFVVNYSHWSPKNPRFCGDSARAIRVYCHPKYFEPVPGELYRNLGGGKFEDVSEKTGIAAHAGRGMGIAFADYDGDGRQDVFVTNDNLPNFLFHNEGGKFEEAGLLAGVALLDHGKPVASMGADFRDYDNDGLPDIAVTALAGETFPVFHNEGGGLFRDATLATKVGPMVNTHSGWGVGWVDFNNDGWKDLFASQSHVNDMIEKFEAVKYKEGNGIYVNLGNGTFRDDSATLASSARAHRGAAFADFDNDGRVDVAVSALGEPSELWRNTSEGGKWLRVRLHGTRSNRDGLGARLVAGGQTNLMTSAVSYSSSVLAPVHFGLGSSTSVRLTVYWPSGIVQDVGAVEAGKTIEVTEPAAP
ncbi:MAG: CRTAC1 family protein [Bryobacteraceae bacterium]